MTMKTGGSMKTGPQRRSTDWLFTIDDVKNIDKKQLFFSVCGIIQRILAHPVTKNFLPLVFVAMWNNLVPWLPEGWSILIARVVFFVKTVITAGILALIYKNMTAKANNGELEGKVTVENQEYTERGVENVKETITFQEYDQREMWKALKMQGITMLMISGVHWKWQYEVPLVIGSVMGLMQLAKAPLYRIYVKGEKEDTAELKRPFKEDGLQEMLQKWQKSTSVNADEKPAEAVKKPSAKSLKMKAKEEARMAKKQS